MSVFELSRQGADGPQQNVVCGGCGQEVYSFSNCGEPEIMFEHPETGRWVCAACLEDCIRGMDAQELAELFFILAKPVADFEQGY